jgi:myo-inositol 2-dehydrogenase / D-chiro-inositol 1-dehydrogenase
LDRIGSEISGTPLARRAVPEPAGRPLRAAIVGCGSIAARFYAPAFAAHPDAELVACTSRTPASAERVARAWGATPYATLADLLERAGPDVLAITTGERERMEPLRAGLAAGRHLIVEKPLLARAGAARVSPEDFARAREALTAWDRQRTVAAINFNYRTMPHFRRLREDLAAGLLGDVRIVSAVVHLACWSHALDLLRWWLGEVDEVQARAPGGGAGSGERGCLLAFRDGAVAAIAGVDGAFEREALLRIELHGTRGRAVVERVDGSYRYEGEDGEVRALPCPDVRGRYYHDSFARSIDAFLAAVRGGGEPLASADDGLAELALEAALSRAAASAGPQPVPEL